MTLICVCGEIFALFFNSSDCSILSFLKIKFCFFGVLCYDVVDLKCYRQFLHFLCTISNIFLFYAVFFAIKPMICTFCFAFLALGTLNRTPDEVLISDYLYTDIFIDCIYSPPTHPQVRLGVRVLGC